MKRKPAAKKPQRSDRHYFQRRNQPFGENRPSSGCCSSDDHAGGRVGYRDPAGSA